MKNFSWSQYWADKKNGQHRFQTENFLIKEAKEKIFHMAGGKSLLDFGCGSGDLLIYFIPEYKWVTGVDFSDSMIKKAQEKIQDFGYLNVKLIHANDVSVWDKIDRSYDRIITVAVIQYLSIDQIEKFIKNASSKLNPNGKIILFDIIDPRRFDLWRAGLFAKKYNWFSVFFRFVKIKVYHLFTGGPDDKDLGFSYDPWVIDKIAQKFGFQMEYVASMYYEYRYHAILYRK